MKSRLFAVAILAVSMISGNTLAHAQSWTQHVDWAARNTDAGGSVDCPQDYLSLGVEYAIVSGGRAAVINDALFSAYRGDVGRAYNLVLLTQCHNSEAYDELLDAGQSAVLRYLIENYTPTGVDPQTVQQGIQAVLTILGSS